jgi:transcriptional regulator with XRE-family HTH domain
MKCPYCHGTGELAATMGALIRQARENAGLTQLSVAERSGVSRAQVANIETDRTDVPTKTLLRIADAIGVRAGDLLP